MKVRLHKKSADGKIMVELEDNVRKDEDGSGALRRLEVEANWFLKCRETRLKGPSLKPSPRSNEVADFLKPKKMAGGGKKAASTPPTIQSALFPETQP